MRRFALILGVVLGLCSSSFGQDVSRVEIFGGYSYLNFDFSTPTKSFLDRESFKGGEASGTFNVNRWLGLEGDFSGHYNGDCLSGPLSKLGVTGVNLTCKDYSFMGGPRFAYRKGRVTAFVHGLFGGDYASGSISGFSRSHTGFALAAGGGFDYAAAQHISIRIGQVDYFMTRHAAQDFVPPFLPALSALVSALGLPGHENNIRVSAGVVFTFGGMRESAPRETAPSVSPRRPPATSQCEAISEAALLGVIGCESANGFLVTSVRAASPAAQAGVKPGDVVVSIDGREVHTSHDIETAVAASASGTVRIGFMVRNAWLTQQEVRVR